MKSKAAHRLYLAAAILLLAAPLFAAGLQIQAVTMPSADITLSFLTSGKVAEILAREGDVVEKGQLLALLDSAPEKIQVEQLKIQAEDRTRILSATAELAQKQVDLKKLESASRKGAASNWEVEHMRLSVKMAELSLQAARIEQEQNRREYQKAVRQLERMRLVSPISGQVEKVAVEAGEAVEKLGPVVQLVKVDPLWIDVPVPLHLSEQMAAGQPVTVSFSGNPAGSSTQGRIIHISAVADAASDTLRVRIEVANSLLRPAGERIAVEFPQVRADTKAAAKPQ